MTWCIYALTPAQTVLPPMRGLGGERLTLVTAGRLAAIVGRLSRAPLRTQAQFGRYHAVQMRLFERTTALLPARFGTAVDSLDDLREILRIRESSLREALRLVRGRAQMTVRVVGLESTGHRERDTGTRPERARRQPSGAAYLRRRSAEAARASAVPGFEPVRRAVQRWVRSERVERTGSVATIYHLVPRSAVGAYRRAIDASSERAALTTVVSGPFPPFAFVEA